MELIHYPNFQTFYKKNRKEIDYILKYFSYKYAEVIELDDMFQELFLRLTESDILEEYDPEKGCTLRSYVVHRIRAYAGHIATTEWKRTKRIPIITCHTDNNIDLVLSVEPDINIESDIYCEEVMEILKDRTKKIEYKIACLCVEGRTREFIQFAIRRYSYNTIIKKVRKIKKLLECIINSRSTINV